MLDIDYLVSEDKDVIIAVLVEKIRDQTCDLENVTERAESSALELISAKSIITQLERELAAAKKAAKPAKVKKAVKPVEPVKRGRGRPKKVVA